MNILDQNPICKNMKVTELSEEKCNLSIFVESALWRRSSKKLAAQTRFQKFC